MKKEPLKSSKNMRALPKPYFYKHVESCVKPHKEDDIDHTESPHSGQKKSSLRKSDVKQGAETSSGCVSDMLDIQESEDFGPSNVSF